MRKTSKERKSCITCKKSFVPSCGHDVFCSVCWNNKLFKSIMALPREKSNV